jgi:hypothetical protein
MKIKLFLLLIAISVILIYCQNDEPIEYTGKISYVKTEYGGCNTQTKATEKSKFEIIGNDSVNISTNNDSINVFVGLNYICCAPFFSDCQIRNDSIFMSIKDTCSDPYRECYCHCSCYYTFNFKFLNTGKSKYIYNIILFSPIEKEPRLIKKGIIRTK